MKRYIFILISVFIFGLFSASAEEAAPETEVTYIQTEVVPAEGETTTIMEEGTKGIGDIIEEAAPKPMELRFEPAKMPDGKSVLKPSSDKIPTFTKEDFIATAAIQKTLRIGMVDCVAMALKNNSEILVKKISPLIEKANVRKEKGAFDPELSADFTYRDNTEVGATPLFVPAKSTSQTGTLNLGYDQKLTTGTEIEVDFNNTRLESNSRIQSPNPYYDSFTGITVTQPLLKGAGLIVNKANFLIAKNNKLKSDQDVIKELLVVLTDVKKSYYDFQYTQEQYRAVEAALMRSEELHRINKERYEKGLASDVDLLQSVAEVSRARQGLAAAENAMKTSEDNLKFITNLIDDPELWNSDIVLLDKVTYEKEMPGLVEAINEAFKYRPDYEAAKIDLKNRDIDVIFYRNGMLPTVDLVGSYGSNGLGKGYRSDMNTLGSGDYQDWSAGVSVSFPFWDDANKGNYEKSKLEKQQALIGFKRLEQNIILQIRDAVRNIDIKYRMLEASGETKKAEERNYEAQELRFKAGLVGTKDMVDYQERLTRAQVNFIKSVIDYKITLIELAKVKGTMLEEDNITLE
ncbi:MAG: TolC family protein [Candidatus Omnitrophica bacterium]|nr:TolC family protein [Candidatus Omnitrophota bacterium]MBU4488715.1 TolC family protein [Candidatus Omnitrophota bacterium]MCG2705744.1 TolC family protein [Candidatus Omnitrophota bacterium]